MASIKTQLIQIGNSQGIRFPKAVIEQCQLSRDIELDLHKDHIVVRSLVSSRKDWDHAFASTKKAGKKEKMVAEVTALRHRWDETEWQW